MRHAGTVKRSLLLLPVALLLSCGTITAPAPATLPEENIGLGYQVSTKVSVPFAGNWLVSSKPEWVAVSSNSGTGAVELTLQVNRAAGTDLKAARPQLSGEIVLTWASSDGLKQGQTIWHVTADQYQLSGRVVDAAQVTASPGEVGLGKVGLGEVGLSRSQPAAVSPVHETRGVIVTYRDTQTREAALHGGLSAQSLHQLGVTPLQSLGLSPAGMQSLGPRSVHLTQLSESGALLQTLRADPAVQSVVANVVLHALSTENQGSGQSRPLTGQALASPVVPTDQYAPLQWAYRFLGYGAVWRDMEAGGYTRPVTVAVVDSGIRYDHPDLAGQVYLPSEGALDVLGYSPSTSSEPYDSGDGDGPDTDPTDPSVSWRPGNNKHSHGTHVTGIIVARWGENPGPTCAG